MKLRKDNAAKAITTAATITLLIAIPTMNEFANLSRAEPSWGGECIAWLIPGMIYALVKIFKEAMES